MGMKILNEDGSVLFEFPDGLGAPLLYRVLAVAKFTGEDQPEIILNGHVSALHRAVSDAMSREPPSTSTNSLDSMAQTLRPRIGRIFRDAVLDGSLAWLDRSHAEKVAFTRDVLFAPYAVSEQFVADFVEEEDWYFERASKALNPKQLDTSQ